MQALAHDLKTTATLINYARRRDALATWSISPGDWHRLRTQLSHQQRTPERALTI